MSLLSAFYHGGWWNKVDTEVGETCPDFIFSIVLSVPGPGQVCSSTADPVDCL